MKCCMLCVRVFLPSPVYYAQRAAQGKIKTAGENQDFLTQVSPVQSAPGYNS